MKLLIILGFSQADIEEMLVETQLAEDRAKKTMIDTARLAGINLFVDIVMIL